MIDYKTGDITTEDAEALVNTVNCVGVMGKGIALAFKQAFPANFKAYAEACERKEVQPGRMFVFETARPTNPRCIINFPTKRHWRGKSRMEDIDSGLRALADEIRNRQIRSIALPPLGSGLGGLDWRAVRRRIEETLREFDDVDIVVFEPGEQAAEAYITNRPPPKMTAGRAALVGLMDRYLAGFLDTSISLLEIHKLMYFVQAAGQPLRLRFEKGFYGPYAQNLRHVLRDMEGHQLTGYTGSEAPTTQLDLLPGALDEANAFLEDYPDTRARLDRVSDLVDGFESPFGLELLSTVHYVASQPSPPEDVASGVYAWNERKRQFSERQIRLALQVLQERGWVAPPTPPHQGELL